MFRKLCKRTFGIILCCVLVGSLAVTSLAGTVVALRWTYTSDILNNLEVSNSGLASVYASITAKSSNSDAVKIVTSLQQKKNGEWVTLKTWEKSQNDITTVLTGSWNVVSGYSYRVYTTYYVYYGGKLMETITDTYNQDY